MQRPIEAPADWRGPALAGTSDWIHVFTPAEIGEIEAALGSARGRELAMLKKEDFPLPRLRKALDVALQRLEDGPGLHVLRGFPAARYAKDDLRLAYWGLGLHLGTAVSQSSNGEIGRASCRERVWIPV